MLVQTRGNIAVSLVKLHNRLKIDLIALREIKSPTAQQIKDYCFNKKQKDKK